MRGVIDAGNPGKDTFCPDTANGPDTYGASTQPLNPSDSLIVHDVKYKCFVPAGMLDGK